MHTDKKLSDIVAFVLEIASKHWLLVFCIGVLKAIYNILDVIYVAMSHLSSITQLIAHCYVTSPSTGEFIVQSS